MQLPLGIPYTTIAGYIEKAAGHQSLWKNCLLAIDAAGVGQPVFDLLRNCRLPVKDLRAVIITSGDRPSRSGHTGNIPRRALLHNLHSRTIGGHHKISGKLPHARTLIRELSHLWYAARSGSRPTLAPKAKPPRQRVPQFLNARFRLRELPSCRRSQQGILGI
ncbi:MAG: hypothetical protein U0Q16_16550 [Bryobacteraceae bacterium]